MYDNDVNKVYLFFRPRNHCQPAVICSNGIGAESRDSRKVLKESLRLYPTVPGSSQWLKEDMIIDGIKIPADVTMTLNSYIMGRMEEFYTDPLTFNPDRFSPDAQKWRPR
ncbi:cholesterol 24-hydroxylase-like [Xenopus laevis]|uniref:Cholesterol 24-hydroxylase-like n=1 Tax=Xenopus laevis TaxID=8355 RepID=A0A8J0U8H4_XENLA|nr:cholesterol 24-hydroxylase-like [Xenopus laevis]